MDTRIPTGLGETDSLATYSGLQSFSKELVKEAQEIVNLFIKSHRSALRSERDIFGTITIEVAPRYIPVVTAILTEQGAALKEIRCEKPVRRNSNVKLVYYADKVGIVNEPEERKSCG